MELILLQKVSDLGALGDRVSVKGGFARNFLIPQGMATRATPENLAEFENRRAELEQKAAGALDAARARADTLVEVRVTIAAKVGDEGKLFGSVGAADIAQAITAAGVAVEKREVRLPEGPFRQVGDYQVALRLHPEVDATVALSVVAAN